MVERSCNYNIFYRNGGTAEQIDDEDLVDEDLPTETESASESPY